MKILLFIMHNSSLIILNVLNQVSYHCYKPPDKKISEKPQRLGIRLGASYRERLLTNPENPFPESWLC